MDTVHFLKSVHFGTTPTILQCLAYIVIQFCRFYEHPIFVYFSVYFFFILIIEILCVLQNFMYH